METIIDILYKEKDYIHITKFIVWDNGEKYSGVIVEDYKFNTGKSTIYISWNKDMPKNTEELEKKIIDHYEPGL